MGENQDISKIIGIIMENPDIIARIKSLADGGGGGGNSEPSVATATPSEPSALATESEPSQAAVPKAESKKRRRELLYALKPYVKNERAKAIDTMLSVIDVIDVMKER